MRLHLTFLIVLLSITTYGQNRIDISIASNLKSFNTTAVYHHSLKHNILISGGIFGGLYGSKEIYYDTTLLNNGGRIYSAYSSINTDYKDTTGNYQLWYYRTKSQMVGIQVGIGYFHEFSTKQSIRFNLFGKFGTAYNSVRNYYYSTESHRTAILISPTYHYAANISAEIAHVFRLSGRTSFYYGLKIPYFLTIDKKNFNTTNPADLLYGFEPELQVGLTYSVGKCD